MKHVSQLDQDGYFVGTVVADESPLEPGVYLIPGGCINQEAPAISEGKRAKWVGEWVLEDIPLPEPETKLPPVDPNIKSITKLQFVEWCEANNKLAALIGLLNSDALLKFKWDAATFLEITNPLVQGAAQTLSLDAQAVFNEIMGQS